VTTPLAVLLALALAAVVTAAVLNRATRRIATEAERLVPRTGRVTPVAGGEIHWRAEGEGPTILCIHGLAGNLRDFTYALAPRLAAEGFRVVSLDRPGCGWSERPGEEAARLPRQAAMIAEFMEAEGLSPAVVVGHSLGGAVALTLALEHPERVAALALVAPLTAPMPDAPTVFKGLEVRTRRLREILAQTLAVPIAKRTGQATLRAVFAPEPPPEDFLVRGGGALALRPKGFRCASEDLVAAGEGLPALAPRWATLNVPGGILYGEADAILDPESQGRAAAERIPGFTLETLPERGHMLPITAPEETAAFVARLARAAG